MRLRPDRAALYAPEIYNVTDEVIGIGIIFAQELDQKGSLACARAKVHVRDENRPVMRHRAILSCSRTGVWCGLCWFVKIQTTEL